MDNHLSSLAARFFEKVKGDGMLQQLFQQFSDDKIAHHPKTFLNTEGYSQEDVQAAHQHIDVNGEHFHSMVDHFLAALDDHGYSEEDKQKVLETLHAYKSSITGE